MDLDNFRERRRFLRVRADFDLRFLSKDIEGKGFSSDISKIGIGLFTRNYLPPNSPVEIWIEDPLNKKEPLHVNARTVYSKEINFFIYRIGVEIDSADIPKINEFLKNHYLLSS
jgi:hypothetical protein